VRILRILAQLLRQDLDLGDQAGDLLDQLGIPGIAFGQGRLQSCDPSFGVLCTLASWSPNRHIDLRSRSDRGVDPPRSG